MITRRPSVHPHVLGPLVGGVAAGLLAEHAGQRRRRSWLCLRCFFQRRRVTALAAKRHRAGLGLGRCPRCNFSSGGRSSWLHGHATAQRPRRETVWCGPRTLCSGCGRVFGSKGRSGGCVSRGGDEGEGARRCVSANQRVRVVLLQLLCGGSVLCVAPKPLEERMDSLERRARGRLHVPALVQQRVHRRRHARWLCQTPSLSTCGRATQSTWAERSTITRQSGTSKEKWTNPIQLGGCVVHAQHNKNKSSTRLCSTMRVHLVETGEDVADGHVRTGHAAVREELGDDDAHRPHVGRTREALVSHRLGGRPPQRHVHPCTRRVQSVVVDKARETKVSNFTHETVANEHVACSEIAVDVTLLLEIGHARRHLPSHRKQVA
eukprot:m.1146773 g.1146773  ORF g.1146773 m.1146773 type:complete len:378 (-) comp24469_c1_seq13:2079-3212(-)